MAEIEGSLIQHVLSYGAPGLTILGLIVYLLKREKHFDAKIDKKDELVMATIKEKDKEISSLTKSFSDHLSESHSLFGQMSLNATRQTQILNDLKDELHRNPNETTLKVMAELNKRRGRGH